MDRLDALEQRVAELERRALLAPTDEQWDAMIARHCQTPFVFAADDMATVEIKPGSLRTFYGSGTGDLSDPQMGELA